jgi:hypothetical protein
LARFWRACAQIIVLKRSRQAYRDLIGPSPADVAAIGSPMFLPRLRKYHRVQCLLSGQGGSLCNLTLSTAAFDGDKNVQ